MLEWLEERIGRPLLKKLTLLARESRQWLVGDLREVEKELKVEHKKYIN